MSTVTDVEPGVLARDLALPLARVRLEVHVLLPDDRDAGALGEHRDQVQPGAGAHHDALAHVPQRAQQHQVGPQADAVTEADVRGEDEPAGVRAQQRAQAPGQAAELDVVALVVDDPDLDAGRQREEGLRAQPLDADDLDVVVLGQEAGEVEDGAHRAAHRVGVRDQDRDLRAVAVRPGPRGAAAAQDQAGQRRDEPVDRDLVRGHDGAPVALHLLLGRRAWPGRPRAGRPVRMKTWLPAS